MKNFKKILALIIACMMTIGMMSAMAFAGTITVTPPENIDAQAQNTYNCYQIFTGIAATSGDAISYQLPTGITTPPAGFSVDTAGNVSLTRTTGDLNNLNDEEIAGIKAYVEANESSLVKATQTVTGSAAATFDNLAVGYYYIDTTVGTLVVIDTAKTTLAVDDKNSVPSLTKEITEASGTITDKNGNVIDPSTADELGKKAIGQLGTFVSYESKITVGKGMKSYVFHDTMDSGLALDTSSIAVTYSAKPEGYVEATPSTSKVGGKDTITINFTDGLAEDTIITINYRAMITNAALTVNPEKNTAYVEYGNGPKTGKTPEEQTETYAAKIGAVKVDATNNNAPLPGAGFKLYKFDTDGTTKLYYHLTEATASVSWGTKEAGDEHFSAETTGDVPAFVGLNDGVYYLEETTVPPGYNKPTSDTQVTISGTEYTAANLEQTKNHTIINNKGVQLPSTGGIGTTIFYIIGGILILGAAIALIGKKRFAK